MKKKIMGLSCWAFLVLCGLTARAWADATTAASATPAPTAAAPSIAVNSMVDMFYSYNFTNSANGMNGTGNNGYGLDPSVDNSYTIGLAEIGLSGTQGPASCHLLLALGKTSSILTANDPAWGVGDIDLLQAYVSYAPGQWTFNFGKMVTHMGYEVIESKSDWNYSRSLLFWYPIPLYHLGLSVGFAPDPGLGITAYSYNGWNNSFANNAYNMKTYGLQVGVKPGAGWTFTLNGIAGPDPFSSTDMSARYVGEGIVTWAVTDKFSLALDGVLGAQDLSGPSTVVTGDLTAARTIGRKPFWGVALYGRYQIASDYAVAARLETLSDDLNVLGVYGATPVPSAFDVAAREATLTFEHNFTPNTLMRLEGRYDYALSGGSVYAAKTGPFAGGSADQVTATGSMVFSY